VTVKVDNGQSGPLAELSSEGGLSRTAGPDDRNPLHPDESVLPGAACATARWRELVLMGAVDEHLAKPAP
jgi:hypothetical protein